MTPLVVFLSFLKYMNTVRAFLFSVGKYCAALKILKALGLTWIILPRRFGYIGLGLNGRTLKKFGLVSVTLAPGRIGHFLGRHVYQNWEWFQNILLGGSVGAKKEP
jgi:hypothetical protein